MATLCWKGSAYAGWQLQPGEPTVQGAVERALSAMCGLEDPVPAVATGRTDAGVHALEQVIGFQLPVERTPEQVVAGLNHHMPDDISCLSAQTMPAAFSPRHWTRSKLYRYRILNRQPACPFRQDYVWHIKQPLDLDAMKCAVGFLAGQHDFSSFRAAGCSAKTTIRTIQRAACFEQADHEVRLEFEGHGFLRHQVRIMVGTMVDVGRGKRSPDSVLDVLLSQDRSAAGITAPAKGLTLVSVELGDGPCREA